ncbi:MAG: metallophosphoesterase [Woeseiaceae bacterium]
MKKFQILSDTHNEFFRGYYSEESLNGLWACKIPPTDADIIILAGDIDIGVKGVEWAINESKRLNKSIVYVPGNHEYYGYDIPETLAEMHDISKDTNVHVLDNSSIILHGVRILGTTLWTDYKAAKNTDQKAAMEVVSHSLNDHRLITYDGKAFTTQQALVLHLKSREWLLQNLNSKFDGPTVVVTHHGPSDACQHKSFPLSPISSAFHSQMDDMVGMADLWIYGHTHSNLDTFINGTRLVSNQFGYVGHEENNDFNASLVVDVG